ncbi:DUF1292 domain-containing protein [Clostridium thermarum]|uniref:DUF1292 domain-containing protein n=1 Tax=Clostridium thermarum TaxID=1716543 RepID=UPI0013D3F8EC|nr:DUF1292 domain-containing protein [Clostridium thermarum]
MLFDERLHDGCCDDEGCGCGHDHDHDHEGCCCGHDHGPMIVDLEDEEGNVVSCEVVDGFEYKDNEYVLVQNPDDGSVYLFKVVGEGDEGELVVPEDSEFEEVTAYYQNLSQGE